jgi:hypothetical protein
MESQVVRCARYARISFDKVGDEHGVAHQLADQQQVVDARGFVVIRTEVDNDIGFCASAQRCPWRTAAGRV